MSWAEAKWTVTSVLQKIGHVPNNMRAFTAFSPSETSIELRFLEPEDSYVDGNLVCAVRGVMIRMSTDDYPTNINEGTLVVNNQNLGAYKTEPFIIEDLEEGVDYYFTAFPYSVQGVYNLSGDISNRTTAIPKGATIYGISRDITSPSPEWTRTGSAIGKTATASVGTTAGASDFDTCYPWSGIVRKTLSTGDVMVKIPKFWFQRYKEDDVEHIRIADKPVEGFALHPLFNHAGVAKDFAYVGAYKSSSLGGKSVSGATPTVKQTRAVFRESARGKGDGWYLMDIAALSAIQMLILVEFANNDVQTAIGWGYCDGDTNLNTGTCDAVPNLTGRPSGTDGKIDVVWRGIEGLWGNVWEFVDGVNWNNGTYYVCNDPSKYADDTATDYELLSFAGATDWFASYITQEGVDTDNSHVMLPSEAGNGSESTYYCDTAYGRVDWRVFRHGGNRDSWLRAGLFTADFFAGSSYSDYVTGSRLLYIP